mgnify:CR=1 FL=1
MWSPCLYIPLYANIYKRYDIDPSKIATKKPKKKRSSGGAGVSKYDDDDTPKSFKRLMIYSEKRQGLRPLDRAVRAEKLAAGSTKKNKDNNNSDSTTSSSAADLKMKKGESWSDFNQRVNEALPMTKPKAGGNGPSKAHRKAQLKQERVRKEQEAAKERRIARGEIPSDEEGNEEEEKKIMNWGYRETRKNKSGKREVSPDPWAHLESVPRPKFGEVADRPPELTLNKKLLNNVPKAAGSMAKRYMLQQERESFIENYRKLMEEKKNRQEF